MARRVVGNKVKAGLKVMAYGDTGSGKSFFGLTAPNSFAIDTESGLLWYEGEDIEIGGKTYNNLKMINTTQDLDELEQDLDDLLEGELEGIETIIIDSVSRFHDSITLACLADAEKKAKQNGKTVDTRGAYGVVKKITTKLQLALLTASAKGIHVIEVCQQKQIEDEKTKEKSIIPACHATVPYDMDIILYFQTKVNKQTKETEYFAITQKDRTGLTKKGQITQNATFDLWLDKINKRGATITSDMNFRKDFENTSKNVEDDINKAERLVAEIKEQIKAKTNKADIKKKLDEKGVDIKNMVATDVKILNEVLEYIKTLD